eukprot:Nk52_evm75s224 gene=Nk52_evmTU75s224
MFKRKDSKKKLSEKEKGVSEKDVNKVAKDVGTLNVGGDDKKRFKAVSDFKLLETLGTGTFGRVFLCKPVVSDDPEEYYAIKILKKIEVVRLKQIEHILSEREILSMIDHPFIVNMKSAFQDIPNLYMVLEFVCGGELFSHLRKAGRFSNEMTRFYASEIALAIEYLHEKDIIYRDMKPENLLLNYKGHIKITDFGFAKVLEDRQVLKKGMAGVVAEVFGSIVRVLTDCCLFCVVSLLLEWHLHWCRTWTLCGTPEYLAPEIIQSKGHGKPVDWWALGVLCYEMLAGYPPFFDDNPFGIYEKILAGKLHFPPHFDVAAKEFVKKLLTADVTKRLGNLKGGADDIKKHKWFKGVDFDVVVKSQVHAPIVPEVAHKGDTRNFEKYPEPEPETEVASTDPFKTLFAKF